MQKEYGICKWSDTVHCPERDKKIMKELIRGTMILADVPNDLTSGIIVGEQVNELMCSRCKSFIEKGKI